MITPIVNYGSWWAKRDDLAHWDGKGAGGAKMRQYLKMAAVNPEATLLVGCSGIAAQQVYVADSARRTGRRAIIVVPARKVRTPETRWAAAQGVEVVEVSPGYRGVCMARAREIAKQIGPTVRWDNGLAVQDAADQVRDFPEGVRRVVIPTGIGSVAAGIIAGLAQQKLGHIDVCVIAVSPMADMEKIFLAAQRVLTIDQQVNDMPSCVFLPPLIPYEKPARAELPDGTPLDSFYAAKVLPYVCPGDLFWIPGCRPVACLR
jgi:1-aminocyclopropane-1-carboxylate deaminase/D-cysteine desulfhydrase-like pyridoxal-dependent ACC family enzyme